MSGAELARGLFEFAFYYPLVMSYVWMTGAAYYFFYRERVDHRAVDDPPVLPDTPPVTFLVPCHNEADNVSETLQSLLDQDYPRFEVIAINDASRDNTADVLNAIAERDSRLRVIHFQANQGKAMGLRVGALAANYEFLVCLDGDAILDRHATRWLMRHFVDGVRVGAVTGNPRVRNRTSLLGKIQVGEFSSIIGLIKRAQRIYGRLFTVSGVVAAFRKSALHRVGYWGLDTVTDDIDVSWRLQLAHWDIRYEPNALCWILMPETLQGLWGQRLRWAQGGFEAFGRYFSRVLQWRSRRIWLVPLELAISTCWAYTMGFVAVLWVLGHFISMPPALYVSTLLPGWTGVLLGTTCLVQFGISLSIDSRYEPRLGQFYYWMIWYPMIYWAIHTAATIVALPRAIFAARHKRAVWESPDRGLRPGVGRD